MFWSWSITGPRRVLHRIFPQNDENSYLKDTIKRGTSFEKGLTDDLPPTTFENRIFERKVKKEESKKKMKETEQEKELMRQLLREGIFESKVKKGESKKWTKETEQEKELMKLLLREVSEKLNTSELKRILKLKDATTNEKPDSVMTEDETRKKEH